MREPAFRATAGRAWHALLVLVALAVAVPLAVGRGSADQRVETQPTLRPDGSSDKVTELPARSSLQRASDRTKSPKTVGRPAAVGVLAALTLVVVLRARESTATFRWWRRRTATRDPPVLLLS